MKNIFLLLIFSQSVFLSAAPISYEKLDSLSALISKYQLRANGLSYNNGYSDYELSFAEQNFGVFFSDQLAYTAVYKKEQGKEVMTLTENIDLTKVSGITREVFNNKVTVVTLYFPKGHLQRQVFDNGEPQTGIPVDYLEFYSNNQPGDYLFKSLFDLCTLFRIEKGLTTEKAAAAEKNDLYVLSDTDFINKYPTSLLARQAAFSIAQKEKKKREEERIENERLEKIRLEKERIAYQKYLQVFHYVDNLCTTYKFKKGLSDGEFRKFNADAGEHIGYNDVMNLSEPNSYIYGNGTNKAVVGPVLLVSKKSIVTSYIYCLFISKKDNLLSQDYYNALLKTAKNSMPAEFIREGEGRFTVSHPDLDISIQVEINYYLPGFKPAYSRVNIDFDVK